MMNSLRGGEGGLLLKKLFCGGGVDICWNYAMYMYMYMYKKKKRFGCPVCLQLNLSIWQVFSAKCRKTDE